MPNAQSLAIIQNVKVKSLVTSLYFNDAEKRFTLTFADCALLGSGKGPTGPKIRIKIALY